MGHVTIMYVSVIQNRLSETPHYGRLKNPIRIKSSGAHIMCPFFLKFSITFYILVLLFSLD